MKKLYFIIFLIFFFGCDQPNVDKQVTNNLPKGEMRFFDELKLADSTYTIQTNDIGKSEALDSGKVKLSNFILKELNGKATNWQGYINQIKMHKWPTKYIEVTLVISKEQDFNEFNSIILKSDISVDNAKIKETLKQLKAKDNVLFSGSFHKNVLGKIDFSVYDGYATANTFTNPSFDIDISDIKKAPVK